MESAGQTKRARGKDRQRQGDTEEIPGKQGLHLSSSCILSPEAGRLLTKRVFPGEGVP